MSLHFLFKETEAAVPTLVAASSSALSFELFDSCAEIWM